MDAASFFCLGNNQAIGASIFKRLCVLRLIYALPAYRDFKGSFKGDIGPCKACTGRYWQYFGLGGHISHESLRKGSQDSLTRRIRDY